MPKNGEFKTIALCGSTRFKDQFLSVRNQLTMAGYVVLGPEVYGHADNIELSDFEKTVLDRMHFQKINMSDEVFIINVKGYIGDSTKREIQYASSLGLPIRYLEKNRGFYG